MAANRIEECILRLKKGEKGRGKGGMKKEVGGRFGRERKRKGLSSKSMRLPNL